MPPPHPPLPHPTSVFLKKSPDDTCWEVKGVNFDLNKSTADSNSNFNSNSRPRRRVAVEDPVLHMDASSPTSSKRPQRRAKEVAIQGLQLAKAEELRDFSDFMDPEEIRARKWKAPAKQKQPTKQAAEAHEDRVDPPPPASKLKRARTPTRRLADEQVQQQVLVESRMVRDESKMPPQEIRSSLTWSRSEKPSEPKRAYGKRLSLTWTDSEEPSEPKRAYRTYGMTPQPATSTAASSDTSTEEEEEVEHPRRPRSQSLSDTKHLPRKRIQRGRTVRTSAAASVKATSSHRQSATSVSVKASAKGQAKASEQQGQRSDEEPAGRIQPPRKNRLLDPPKRDSLSARPESTRTKMKKPNPSVENVDIAAGDEHDQGPDHDHVPIQITTTDVETPAEADEMAVANFMVNNLATSDSPQRIVKQEKVAHQDSTIQSQEQDQKDSQHGISDSGQQNVKQEEVAKQDVSIRSQEQDVAKASQNSQDSPPSYDYKVDPNQYYIEESAYIYHNPPLPTRKEGRAEEKAGVPFKELRPIPPPPTNFPPLPDTGYCKWSWDEPSRVLLAAFSESEAPTLSTMDIVDEKFFLEMLERDDITVISAGLVSPAKLDHSIWNLEYISHVLNDEYCHKIRRFDTDVVNGVPKCVEKDKMISMKPCDYVQYIRQRRRVLMEPTSEEKEMTFTDQAGIDHSINVETTALYMTDLDIGKLLPKMYSNFVESMRMPGVLPGGAHCMMSAITSNARPFMGPNLYITPPASFTYFHQDGHGTVDSGHLCVSGYNEIILLRRLTERHKKHALWLLTGDPKYLDASFDGLYQEPHSDGLGEKPAWPTNDVIDECTKMGYCPSLCILKPGQMIHINKGRLHACRMLSNHKLPEDDCHATLREMLVQEENLEKEQLCISVAWDWMYRGVTAAGINREVCTTLECAGLNRKNKKMPLAIPELSLLHMSRSILSEDPLCDNDGDDRKIFGFELTDQHNKARPYEPSSEVICCGILPGLRHIVKHHVNVMQRTKANNAPKSAFDRVSVMERPNADENPMLFSVDPYGVGDFFCKLCHKELSNVYFHCDGCEKILTKDFNICEECHSGKMYKKTIQMHPVNNKRHSTINHTGDFRSDRTARCPCRNGPICKLCGFCSGCSCRCHSHFTLNCRFFDEESEQKLATRLELLLEKKSGSKLPQDVVSHTEQRLSLVS